MPESHAERQAPGNPPPYERLLQFVTRPHTQALTSTPPTTTTVKQSPRHPRVAVLLGVPQRWFVPLLLCRGLSMGFAVWWAVITSWNVATLVGDWDKELQDLNAGKLRFRLVVVQLVLAYLWASTAAYLCHLFAASLMSRWLLHYSPLAVLVRLCSLGILLSYGLSQSFSMAGAMDLHSDMSQVANLEHLSVGLSLWVGVSVVLLLGYFVTQQDISVDGDKDDRRRRLVLRFQCLVAMAGSSLVSLLVLISVIRLGESEIPAVLTRIASS